MKYVQWSDITSLAVKQMGKRAVYIANHLTYSTPASAVDIAIWNFVVETVRAKYATTELQNSIIGNLISGGLFFFENEKEQYEFYRIFESDPVYASGLYALTFDEFGEFETENT